MTPLAEILSSRIRSEGPMLFSDFMEAALYDPEHGYYRAPRDPFGKEGDFFTASQLQPVFGRLVAAAIREHRAAHGNPESWRVIEWGAGRREMAPHLSEFGYASVEAGARDLPAPFTGVIFCNELFDALPVDVASVDGGEMRMMRAGWEDGSFQWVRGEAVAAEWRAYVESLVRRFEEPPSLLIELPVRLRPALERMSGSVERGALIAIDYGYTEREIVRFPAGTLMSYRKHRALDDVLREPGHQDITAHVPFTHLEECARQMGFQAMPLQTLAQFLLKAGEGDQFASALEAADEAAAARLRLQLKSLLFGMGETFRVLTLLR